MGKFELPPLDDKLTKNTETSFNSDDINSFTEEDNDNLIDIEEPYDIEDSADENIESSAELSLLMGTVIETKVNDNDDLTIIKLKKDMVETVYIQLDKANHELKSGQNILVEYNPEFTNETKTGIPVFSAESIEIDDDTVNYVNPVEDLDSDANTDDEPVDNSIKGKINNAIAAVKAELANSKNSSPEDEEKDDEDSEPEEEEEKKPKEKKKRKSKKKGKNLYIRIADWLYTIITKGISIIGRLPLIGRILRVLGLLNPIIKFITRLWLPILIIIAFLLFKPTDKIPQQNEIIKDDTSILILNSEIKNDQITLEIKNNSNLYADFYFTATVKQKSWNPFSKKTTECISPIIVLGIDEETTTTLTCDVALDNAELQNSDIVINY